MDTTIPFHIPRVHLKHKYIWKFPDFETHTKKSSLQIYDICIWVTSMSSFFYYWTHVEELVFVQFVWPIRPRNKMTYEAHHIKTNEKQVYSHFPMKLNSREKGNKHNFVSWSYHVPFVMKFLISPILN